MVEPITINVRHLSQDVRLPQDQVQAAIDLLDAGFPIPFIARYRKEITKNLGEEALRQIEEELRAARTLCERKQTILKTIESAGKLTPELDTSIRDAKSVKRLEDIYLLFKPKRQQVAVKARESGLEPLALEILDGTLLPEKVDERAAEFINEDKKVKSVADVLFGTGHIIADMFSCKAELMQKVREILYQHGLLTTTKIERPGEKTADGRRQTAEEIVEESSEPQSETLAEPQSLDCESETEEETADGRRQTAEESPSEPQSSDCESETEEETAGGEPQTAEDEVTALFEQHQAAQAEKGLPVVRSQNSIKKKKRAEAKKKHDEIKQRQRDHFDRQFTEYFNYSVKLRGIPAHRILSINRGERHKVIQVAIKIDEAKILESVKDICVPPDHIHADFLISCLADALHRSVVPALTREIRDEMTEYAERNAIKIFGQNLRHLLLQRPLPQKRVLALEPSGHAGCWAVALDEFGNLIGHESVLFTSSAERRKHAENALAEMIRKFDLSVIAIGIGGGSRAAEEAVAHMIESQFADSELSYIMINKAGSVSYATSPAAKEEFPGEDVSVRAAVSIGRRLQNPMIELVKIDPVNLGLGAFHIDMRGKHINQMLTEVIESCVNLVGVNLNTASSALLTHIAGLNLMTARRIYEYRHEHGAFRTREDLRKVPGISETIFTYSAGFLRIADGDNPLDSTNIHPESYELATNILEKLGFAADDLQNGDKVKALAEKIAAERIGELTVKFSADFNAGLNTVRDILENLSKPERDARESQPPLMFRRTALKLDNLTPGMELTGTILNVTDFGAFVDIGLQESGFVHVSQMATGYIQNAHEKVAMGNTVRLWVVEADVAKKRVSLSLLPPGTERQQPKSGDRERERPPRDRDRDRERAPRPSRPEGERREFSSDKPRGDRQRRDSRDGQRFDRKPYDRAPKTFVSAAAKKDVKPITEKMKEGKEPMRSFSDLAQLFGRVQTGEEESGKK
ncbi:MAG: helix-hairpin-helix domain-containing protein [Planctomycetaceae bacterium]|jgi:uncharacterized protein|nr:helix-hairpin-helix domain-containing protein [Planctomycetaceae bacterium]